VFLTDKILFRAEVEGEGRRVNCCICVFARDVAILPPLPFLLLIDGLTGTSFAVSASNQLTVLDGEKSSIQREEALARRDTGAL
jgi:hypothetical protein